MNQDSIIQYYNSGIENNRLTTDHFKLEGIRSKEIISRYLGASPLKILDVGGGAGYYSFWLQGMGHDVTLLDISPQNILAAEKYSDANNIKLKGSVVGDALSVPFEEGEFDMVLLFGPLYHLINRDDRIKALQEARRVVKKGGIILSAVISRYASMIDGFHRNLIADDKFVSLLKDDLDTGIHLNETNNPEYFTTAFFHTPHEIINEIKESNLEFKSLIAVESIGWLLNNLPNEESNPAIFKTVIDIIKKVESEMDLIAASPHIIAVAHK